MASTTFADTAAGGQAPSTGAAAYACAVLGFRVFPLVPGTGLPALKAWPDIATADVAVVREWWMGDYAGYGVGVATGAGSGVWVLDIDVKNGVNGFASLEKLCEGQDTTGGSDLARTLTVATPSGGAHLYFRWPAVAGVPCSTGGTNALGSGLDVRGSGGYVRGPGWGGYQVVPRGGVRSVGIAASPGWLVDLARAKPERERRGWAENQPNGEVHVMGTRRTLDSLYRTPVGSRNHELNRAAFRLALRGELTHGDAWSQCQRVLVAMGAGDGMNDWRRTFESGWQSGIAKRGTEAL